MGPLGGPLPWMDACACICTNRPVMLLHDSEQVKREPLESFACNVSILAGDRF